MCCNFLLFIYAFLCIFKAKFLFAANFLTILQHFLSVFKNVCILDLLILIYLLFCFEFIVFINLMNLLGKLFQMLFFSLRNEYHLFQFEFHDYLFLISEWNWKFAFRHLCLNKNIYGYSPLIFLIKLIVKVT